MPLLKSVSRALPALLLLSLPAVSFAVTAEVPVVRITNEADIAASPGAIWSYLTTGKNFATWCPEWKAPANTKINLSKVGDTVEYMDGFGNGGRSIVTWLVPQKEIRIVHEPANGSYMCQTKVTFTASGSGTHVVWVEQYTDESGPTDKAATMAKMEEELALQMKTVRGAVEKKM